MELFNGDLSAFWARHTKVRSPWSQDSCDGVTPRIL